MALCYYADDVKAFGWNKVLRPLLNDLRNYEETGISFNIHGKQTVLKLAVSCFTGDNLFLNSIIGFVESFSANFPCRHCLAEKCNFSKIFKDDVTIRTRTLYEKNVAEQSVSTTGIKESSALNQLLTFHAGNNYCQDIMHDIFEGICLYDMKLICSQLICNGCFTLADLNNRVQSLNYGYYDITNKPPVITKVHLDSEQLCMEAVQAWCFVRIFFICSR